ncbi:baseplate J/gp47 family protein [Flavobacterium sp. J27]|uniref:baseplate J/gp47 family protein n=1 Tax=Flavobacterium sp. J27 TaxID=2060419 RepID=UPI001030089C|nr:baseplate J/gp47 family protein [Flavobacterium sp. J27]
MSTNCNTIVSVLTKNGTDQKQRYIAALQPNNTQLLDFDISDWILFAYNFASHINYFETNNPSQSIDDWTSFFNQLQLEGKDPSFTKSFELQRIKEALITLLEDYKKEGALTPHLTLFVTFLLLLEQSKKRFNALTKRHLDFYYKDILHIEKLPAKPDKVYLLFELAKNATQQRIAKGTSFDGGKDANGKTRIYKSTDELIANKATVSLLKNIYHDKEHKKIVVSPIANSLDGIGGQFSTENTQYWPFGHVDASYPELPNATLGFAIASPILVLKEGKRSIEFVFTFKNNITNTTINQVINNTTIYLTTQKGWFQVPVISSSVTVKTGSPFVTSVQNKTLKIAFQLDENVDAITNYNSKIFGTGFNDELPLAKFIINTATIDGYELYRSLVVNTLKEVTINVDVQNIKSVVLENDNSTINESKPFFPFTTIPLAGSNFYVQYEEAFLKHWEKINFTITWKNTPNSFSEHYKAYKQGAVNTISTKGFIDLLLKDESSFITDGAIVTGDDYFKYDLEILSSNIWTKLNSQPATLFTKSGTSFKTEVSVTNSKYETAKKGKIRILSKHSFLHQLYPKIYALALASKKTNIVIPNEPYTPLAENIVLHYNASETSYFVKQDSESLEETYKKNKTTLFHIHPFGFSEEHSYLKSNLDFVTDKNTSLLPIYCAGGELFIGLGNTKELEQITLLFQILEGSENPLTPSFTGNQKIEWSVLGNNQWKTLDYAEILLNETDNLLRSGILKFNLPKEATQNNTVLPENYIWLKGKMHKKYDAVCKIIGIHAQVVLAVFEDNVNELAHLKTGLEAETISKLTQRVSMVKSVKQPYNSFDYRTTESNEDYYRRVSERLRHKNRAITMWDYEHIILQEFPELYKVKCLNHTSETSFQAPGNVTLVVVPDTVNKNVFDIYQPRVSTATLNKVQNHIDQLHTMHTNTFVINPNYEVVTVSLAVKFKTGFDVNFYTKELGKDITKFLSPWAYDKTIPITFGVSVHISVLIDYLEKLGYVDYLENVRLIKNGGSPQKMVTPSNPKSILVSAKETEHLISTNIKGCKIITIEENETCQ